MNLDFVRQVGRDNPTWLPTNLGSTCFAHTSELVRRIRAAGHEAWFVCKMAGEGGYAPPGFTPRTVAGLDGKPYMISLVSHDVIFFREAGTRVSGSNGMAGMRQFDTLASANEHDRPIYRRNGDPNWSFNPNDGPQITASGVWNEVASDKWRPWNPPFFEAVGVPAPEPHPTPMPTPTPPTITEGPPRDQVGRFFAELDAYYKRRGRADRFDGAGEALHVDNEGLFVWLGEFMWRYLAAPPNVDRYRVATDAAFAAIDREWR